MQGTTTDRLIAAGFGPRWQQSLDQLAAESGVGNLRAARVSVEHRGAYEVVDTDGVLWAELPGRLRHRAASPLELPAVGDWVAIDDSGRIRGGRPTAQIHGILPRTSCFVRRAAGMSERPQVVATNVDIVFVVTSANADLNPRRVERYVVAVREAGARPVVVLNKIDLASDENDLLNALQVAAPDCAVLPVSATQGRGLATLTALVSAGVTAVFVGSSGVGKSSLINAFLGRSVQTVRAVRAGDDRGQHTTTRRELMLLETGGVLIDTPGMRELQLWSDEATTADAFADIATLAAGCRFRDCRHLAEPGCAVRPVVTPERLANFQKLTGAAKTGRVARQKR